MEILVSRQYPTLVADIMAAGTKVGTKGQRLKLTLKLIKGVLIEEFQKIKTKKLALKNLLKLK